MMKRAARVFDREGKSERRTFCPCELCRLRFNRMLYNRYRSGEPLRGYRWAHRRPALCRALGGAGRPWDRESR